MGYNVADLFEARERDRFALHSRYLNEQMVRVLRAIGYDVGFCRGEGQYLYDREGIRYLDLLSGFGVFAVGRNHPTLREALKSVLDSQLPNLVQMDVSTLAAILAERLLARVPYLDKAFFLNSGSEAVEAAIKFARAATGLHCVSGSANRICTRLTAADRKLPQTTRGDYATVDRCLDRLSAFCPA